MNLLNRLSYRLPFIRGNDGLTGRERRGHARAYAEGPGKTPTKEELRRYRALAPVYRFNPDGTKTKIADNWAEYQALKAREQK